MGYIGAGHLMQYHIYYIFMGSQSSYYQFLLLLQVVKILLCSLSIKLIDPIKKVHKY